MTEHTKKTERERRLREEREIDNMAGKWKICKKHNVPNAQEQGTSEDGTLPFSTCFQCVLCFNIPKILNCRKMISDILKRAQQSSTMTACLICKQTSHLSFMIQFCFNFLLVDSVKEKKQHKENSLFK